MKRNFKNRKRKSGFTLLEIMVVVFIIGILMAIAVPNLRKATDTSQTKACVANLKQIQAAKDRWAIETKARTTATPSADVLYGPGNYIENEPTCPGGGRYTIRNVVTNPTCSIGGDHAIQ